MATLINSTIRKPQLYCFFSLIIDTLLIDLSEDNKNPIQHRHLYVKNGLIEQKANGLSLQSDLTIYVNRGEWLETRADLDKVTTTKPTRATEGGIDRRRGGR